MVVLGFDEGGVGIMNDELRIVNRSMEVNDGI